MPSVMQIGRVILMIDVLPVAMASILVSVWFLGPQRNNLLSLDPVLKQSTGVWP
jgi:hypothetical protein